MTTVRIIRSYDFPDIMRQTPGGKGVWGDISFTEEAAENPDYVLVLNQPSAPVTVTCAPENIWAVIQEPPTPFHTYLHRGQKGYARIYTTDETLADPRYRHAPPMLPWHVDRDYDTLCGSQIPDKSKDLSWITSSLGFLPGHKQRMDFLGRIRGKIDFDLFGKGFDFIEDKWDALAPYRYTIVYENFICPLYFSEKLTDAWLAGCMPIYVGSTALEDFFPSKSFIRIEPNDGDIVAKIKSIISSDSAEQNRDAIIEARDMVLHKWNLFEFIAGEISKDSGAQTAAKQTRLIKRKDPNPINRLKAYVLSRQSSKP